MVSVKIKPEIFKQKPCIFKKKAYVCNRIKVQVSINNLVKLDNHKNIIFTEPVGYLEMLFLIKNAIKVITDSGGLQKETYILDTPVITIRDQTEWTETLIGNYNILSKPTSEDILYKVFQTKISKEPRTHFYGNADASIKISDILSFSTL